MKKRIFILLLLTLIFIPINANAKTLGQLKKEYSALEQKYNSKNNEIKNNQTQTSATKARIQSIYTELEASEKEIQNKNSEISKLNDSIAKKREEIKDIMKFFQTSEGESVYLEYIFKADSITDFIYRLSVTEQLTQYNDKLMSEMNNMIIENKKNIEELHKKEESLKALRVELNEKLNSLAVQREQLSHDEATIAEEVKVAKSTIDYYKKSGCKDNEDITSCGDSQLPPDTRFWRPLRKGHLTEFYGYRICPVHGSEFHSGLDMSGYDLNIYPVANGEIVYAGWMSGFGNTIIMTHNINGKYYSSLYGHMARLNVRLGSIVTKDTVIGIMGNTGASAGVHLHLNLYEGKYPAATRVNPKSYINFPSYLYGGGWSDRTSYLK